MPGVAYPRLIEVTGRCPPEDVGGPWGYEEFLEAIADPKHVRHAELTEWIGEAFDPDAVDTEGHANALADTRHAVVAKARRHTQAGQLTRGPDRRS